MLITSDLNVILKVISMMTHHQITVITILLGSNETNQHKMAALINHIINMVIN